MCYFIMHGVYYDLWCCSMSKKESLESISSVNIEYEINLIKLKCDLYPELKVRINENGELESHAVARSEQKIKNLTQLVDTQGNLIYPQNLYLTICARRSQSMATSAQALLMFTRWLRANNKSYRDVFADPTDGAPWQFAKFLVRSIRTEIRDDRLDTIELSTAKTYMRRVIDFYKWLNREGIFTWSDNKRPFNFFYKRLGCRKSRDYVDMLSHTKRNHEIVVQTTDVMKIFPRAVNIPQHKKLKPMTDSDLNILESYLQGKGFSWRNRLIIQLSYLGGLRVEEVASLNESAIYQPRLGDKECELSLLATKGVDLKGDKSRVTKIPASLMGELFDYKISIERLGFIKKIKDIDPEVELRFFLSDRTKEGRIKTNTIQSFWSELRNKIQAEHSDWYYRYHDLRSTFATNWLLEKMKTSDLPIDFHFSELKSLLGHTESTDTMVYIDFYKDRELGKQAAIRRNMEAQ